MNKKVFVAIFLAILFSIVPVIWFDHLPLIDYPNHLARLQIYKTLESNSFFAQFYEFHWVLTPYLGLDLLAIPFIPFLPIEVVGRIVIALTFVLIYLGTILLDRELNPNNWGVSLFSGIFLYNGAFNWGFTNYIIGIGFAILTFWIWVHYREKSVSISIILFSTLGGIVCLMHFYAFAIYAVCVAGYECSVFLERLRHERRLRMSLFRTPFVATATLTLPLLVMLSRVSGNHGVMVWGQTWEPLTFWDSLIKWKAEAIASPIFFHHFSEKPLLVTVFATLVWALATRTLVVNSRMVVPLAALAVMFIVMPAELLGSFYADYRLPSGVAFFAWGSLGWGDTSRVRIKLVSLLLAFCLIARVGSILSAWHSAQPIIEEYDSAMQLIPPGSRLLVKVEDLLLLHVPALAAAKHGVFAPGVFTDHGQGVQLLKMRIPIPKSITDFDYLLQVRNSPLKIPTGISLHEVGRGQTFTLFRIDQGTATTRNS